MTRNVIRGLTRMARGRAASGEESRVAEYRSRVGEGGTSRSSEEPPVMGGERRGRLVGSRSEINQRWEESGDRDKTSRQAV